MHDFVLKACNVFEKILYGCAAATVLLWALGALTPFMIEFNVCFIAIDVIGIWVIRKLVKICKENGIE